MSKFVIFVVDTSVSMGQSLGGLSALDASKAACEHYLKKRQGREKSYSLLLTIQIACSAFSKVERVMLISCAAGMGGVLVGWKDAAPRLLEVKRTCFQ